MQLISRQTNDSVEQDRAAENEPHPHMWSFVLLRRCQTGARGKERLINGPGTSGCSSVTGCLYIIPCLKINLGWAMDLNTKGKTKELLGENILKNLHSLWIGKSFLDKTQKQFPKLKNNGTNIILLN